MNILKLLLYPFAAIYNGVMRLRNHLYDIGQKPSFQFQTSVIVVGNLNVGGSGKTPMVEYLIRLLSHQYPTVALSRGYKRETSGYRVAVAADTAKSIGDEPLQMFRKFGDRIHVVVGEDRVFAIPHILQEFPETKVLLLDDALQQRSIESSFSVLLTSSDRPFYNDFVLPFGRLRESRRGASRADVVVVTKCGPELSVEDQEQVKMRIQQYAPSGQVFFSYIRYGDPKALRDGNSFSDRVVLVTGIANADPVEKYCNGKFKVLRHFKFNDHHHYSLSDLQELDKYCKDQGELSILTTEKDMVKIDVADFEPFLNRWKWFSLPIEHTFLKDGAKFDELVLDSVKRTLNR